MPERLIDANKLLKMRFSKGFNDDGELLVPFSEVMKAIRLAPTVDAVEVRHGHWERLEVNAFNSVGTCSVCKKRMKLFQRRYCPLCGAKMDGKGEGE